MLIHRHQRVEKTISIPEMSRLQTSSRYLSNRLRFKRWIFTRYGFLFIIALLVVFFNEILFYQWTQFHWPDIESIAKK
jgi:hypothetical protein